MCGSHWGLWGPGWDGQITTSLIYVSGHMPVLSWSFFRLRRRPRILQIFPVDSLRARPIARVFSELIWVSTRSGKLFQAPGPSVESTSQHWDTEGQSAVLTERTELGKDESGSCENQSSDLVILCVLLTRLL